MKYGHDCAEVDRQMEWLTDSHIICLGCGSPMPRPGTPLFTKETAAFVLELWPDGELTAMDVVHVECVDCVGGIEADLNGFSAAVLVRPVGWPR